MLSLLLWEQHGIGRGKSLISFVLIRSTTSVLKHTHTRTDTQIVMSREPELLGPGPSSLFLFQLTLFLRRVSVHLFLSAFIFPSLSD